MEQIIDSIGAEYHRYRTLGEATIAQLSDDELCRKPSGGGNSIATLAWHVSGNLASRFTDFLSTDGEKPWRDRESEFADRDVTKAELLEKWTTGWDVLFQTLEGLGDEDLKKNVSIRGVALTVHEALHRSLAHTSYHVGQIVYRAKTLAADRWKYLSIPPGGSAAYNQDPSMEKPASHAARVDVEGA